MSEEVGSSLGHATRVSPATVSLLDIAIFVFYLLSVKEPSIIVNYEQFTSL